MIISVFLVLIPLTGLVLLGVVIACAANNPDERLKRQREQAKLDVDLLRRKRLERDLLVVENRAHLIATQEAVAALRIEKLRRELGYSDEPFTPQE